MNSPQKDNETPDTLPESEVASRTDAPTPGDSVIEGRQMPTSNAEAEDPDSDKPDPQK